MPSETPIIEAVLQNIYTGPVVDMLERHMYGQFKITYAEWFTSIGDEREFVATLYLRLRDLVGRMVDEAWGRDRVKDYNHMRGN